LNKFTLFLGLSDKLMMTEADFFHTPHTTRIIWSGHRVIYIFSEATGKINLYYDIELKEPIRNHDGFGGVFKTTTLITKDRIFVPVPHQLVDEFKVESETKEFFVRHDILYSYEIDEESSID
jgi:molecular chaperone HtpG